MSRSGNAIGGVGGLGQFTELRQRLLFVLGAMIVYRLGCFIPVPGVNPEAMTALMDSQKGTIVDMFNMFSGGALHRFSVFALNVMPYISASIIIQLCAQIFPSLKAIQKEGESGRRKITQWARLAAVPLPFSKRSVSQWHCRTQAQPTVLPLSTTRVRRSLSRQ